MQRKPGDHTEALEGLRELQSIEQGAAKLGCAASKSCEWRGRVALVTSSEAAVLQIWESETRCFLGCVTAGGDSAWREAGVNGKIWKTQSYFCSGVSCMLPFTEFRKEALKLGRQRGVTGIIRAEGSLGNEMRQNSLVSSKAKPVRFGRGAKVQIVVKVSNPNWKLHEQNQLVKMQLECL